ncbi:MAG: hypothetical protein ACN6O1_00640 [Comamonas sp.]|uniref:hypothetical protein n=1 Tax=Comamonas sp. TaxID=34028 RepID=UPI003D0E1AC9
MKVIQRIFFILIFGFICGWSWYAGKDHNWDQLNYHLYAVHLLMNSRWQQDYYAASIQSYLNPVSYLPFYYMVREGVNDVAIALILTSLHFINIVIVWLISKEIFFENYLAKIAAVILAALTPVYLIVVGTSFNDPIASIFILSAVYLIVKNKDESILYFFSGIVFGIAVGIKLTNGVFLFGFLSMMVYKFRSDSIGYALKIIVGFCISTAIGFLVIHGYWSWILWVEYKNPFFPFFNSYFKSLDYLPSNIHDNRFLGEGFWGLIKLPWDMMKSQSWIYIETSAPDLRIFFLSIAFLVILVHAATSSKAFSEKVKGNVSFNNLVLLTIFFIISFVFWGVASRIGRYAIPIWLLTAPLLVGWWIILLGNRRGLAVISIIIAFQCLLINMSNISGWSHVRFSGNWIDVKIPKKLKDSPATFLTLDTQTLSALALYVHNRSSFVNLVGMYTQPVGQAMSARLLNILEKNQDVYVVLQGGDDIEHDAQRRLATNYKIAPYGFELNDSEQCMVGNIGFDQVNHADNLKVSNQPIVNIFYCPLRRILINQQVKYIVHTSKYDRYFDQVEEKCKNTFLPSGVQTTAVKNGWARSYFNSANTLYVEGGVMYSSGYRTLFPEYLGNTSDEDFSSKMKCPGPIKKRYLE